LIDTRNTKRYNLTMEKETKKEMTIDDLALMVAKGFNDISERMEKGFQDVDRKFIKVHEEMNKSFGELKAELDNLKADDNKKVDRFTHNDLVYRVEKLEKKFA
jgi:hypothetical protein